MSDDLKDPGDLETPAETSFPTAEEMDALLPDFQITEVIGEGGMGVVYRAWQERLERYVAIKVLPAMADADGGENFAEQFKKEARTMAALHHSHIVTVYDFGVAGGMYYLVMEHVDGSNLFEHFRAGSYSPEELVDIILHVCDALDYAHSSGVIHRDIKSANILIGQDGMTKVVDFGLATLQDAPGVLRRRKLGGASYGTPGYSAPELFHYGAHCDHRADIYSLAVVLYEGLTGKTMSDQWTSPSLASGVPVSLDRVIRKATRKDPKDRYQTIKQFAAALQQPAQTAAIALPVVPLAQTPVAQPHAAAPRPARPASSKGPAVLGWAGLAGLAILIYFVVKHLVENSETELPNPGGTGEPTSVDTPLE